MVQIKGKWHTQVCSCEACSALRTEACVQLENKEKQEESAVLSKPTTRSMISLAALSPKNEHTIMLKDNMLIRVFLTRIYGITGIRNHTKSYWYVNGKRVSRATAAIVLRNHT
jgi:hypothetical protein